MQIASGTSRNTSVGAEDVARDGGRKRHLGVARLAMLILSPVLIYLALSSQMLSSPGIYYDEVLQAVPAIAALKGSVNGEIVQVKKSVVTVGGHPFPLLILPYLGSTQAGILTVVFALVGASVLTMRATFVALGILPLVFTFLFTRRLFSTRAALIGSLLLATDPIYIFSMRSDNGPTAIMMICKMGALWSLLAWWQERRSTFLYLAAFLCGFGLYDKVNFAWFLGALGAAAALFYVRDLLTRISRSPRLPWFVAMLCFCAGASVLIIYTLLTGGGAFRAVASVASGKTALGVDNSNLLDNLAYRIDSYMRLLQGYEILDFYTSSFAGYHYPFERGLFPMTMLLPLAAIALSILAIQAVSRIHWVPEPRKAMLLLVLSALVVAASTITPTNLMYHHLLVAYPFMHLFVAQFLASLPALLRCPGTRRHCDMPVVRRGSRWRRGISALILTIALVSNLGVVVNYYRVLDRTGGVGMWSDAIYGLNEYLAGDQRTIVSMDWGISLNLFALSNGELHTQERWQEFLYSDDYSPKMAALIAQPNHVFVFHAPKYSGIVALDPDDQPRRTFFTTVEMAGRTAVLERRFLQRNGDVLFELYTVVPNIAYRSSLASLR